MIKAGFHAGPLLAEAPKAKISTAFGCPYDFLGNRFIYAVISSRARGLSIGVNMNPDHACNFDCAYCEVNRSVPAAENRLDVKVMAVELAKTLDAVRSGEIRNFPFFSDVSSELLKLRHVALSGDGEPTLCPNFAEAVQTVMHVRAKGRQFFKVVLITNATGFDQPEIQQGLGYLSGEDEIWAKLEAGTQAYMSRVNGTDFPLKKVIANILLVARQRPVVIQSLFPSLNKIQPSCEEVMEYAKRLRELKDAGAQIPLVQIYSATRPTPRSECGHLPLRVLSQIAQTVRDVAGLKVEIF